jgi:hypothetical protein
MSEPAFVAKRHEVWFTDGTGGFYALRPTNGVWAAGSNGCRRATFSVRLPRGSKVKRVRSARGRVTRKRRHGRRLRVTVRFAKPVSRGTRVRLTVRLRNGRAVHARRRVRACR